MAVTGEIVGWFDPRGRLSRRAYARLFIRLSLWSMALLCLAVVVGAQGWRDAAIAAAGGIAALWLASLAQFVRRLHDRGRTGWWLALSLALSTISFAPVERLADAYPLPVIAYVVAMVGVTLWLLLETLGRRGTRGPNRYGADPAD